MKQYQDSIDIICNAELKLEEKPGFQCIVGELPQLEEAVRCLNVLLTKETDPEQRVGYAVHLSRQKPF